jgi:hypothetical protein
MEELYNAMQDDYNQMQDAHQRSQWMWGLTIAVWLYNMADSVFFFPDQSGIELTAESHACHSKLILSIKF